VDETDLAVTGEACQSRKLSRWTVTQTALPETMTDPGRLRPVSFALNA
jgi:hypothetical protein